MDQPMQVPQDAILKMIGEREVRIAFLTDQLGQAVQEVNRLRERLKALEGQPLPPSAE